MDPRDGAERPRRCGPVALRVRKRRSRFGAAARRARRERRRRSRLGGPRAAPRRAGPLSPSVKLAATPATRRRARRRSSPPHPAGPALTPCEAVTTAPRLGGRARRRPPHGSVRGPPPVPDPPTRHQARGSRRPSPTAARPYASDGPDAVARPRTRRHLARPRLGGRARRRPLHAPVGVPPPVPDPPTRHHARGSRRPSPACRRAPTPPSGSMRSRARGRVVTLRGRAPRPRSPAARLRPAQPRSPVARLRPATPQTRSLVARVA